MTSTMDLKSTLNLPQTTFPMKANLPQAEPKRLEAWQASDLYGQVRAARQGAPRFIDKMPNKPLQLMVKEGLPNPLSTSPFHRNGEEL